MVTRQPDNFTPSQFLPLIPIKRRTFTSIKTKNGQQVLIDIKNLFSTDLTRAAKKRSFYDGFKELDENLKDIIWEAYMQKQLEEELNETNK